MKQIGSKIISLIWILAIISWSTTANAAVYHSPKHLSSKQVSPGQTELPSNFAAVNGSGALTSPVYALWNGFLEMVNVLELVNRGNSTIPVQITLYDIAGNAVNTFSVSVSGRTQQDFVLNNLTGFSTNSYGSVRLEFSGQLDGRISFYRGAAPGNPANVGQYELAFSVPFCNALSGDSNVPFNTYQPSLHPFEAGYLVHNWLSVFNQHPSESKNFTVRRYDQLGNLLSTQQLVVGPLQRRDIDGGHGEGPSVVGLNEIIPADPAAPYHAQLIRYGSLSTNNSNPYLSWAFPLSPAAGSVSTIWAPISSGAGAQNWVELANVSNVGTDVQVTFYDNSGSQLAAPEIRSIPAHAQLHLEASALLPSGASGAIRIVPQNGGVIANSMFYFRSAAGSIDAMYGSPARAAITGNLNGSWNLFLAQLNWLRVFNTNNQPQEVTVTVENGATVTTQTLTLAAHAGADLGLHDAASYGTTANAYGIVTVRGQNIISDLLRIRPVDGGSGAIDYVFPTAITCCGSTPPGPTGQNTRIPMGWNMEWIAPWSGHLVFVDAFKRSLPWVAIPSDLSGWDTGSQVPIDSNGYPLEVPFMADGQQQVVGTFFYTDMNGNYPTGTYTLIFEGTGSIFISIGDDDFGPYTTGGTYQVPVASHPDGIFLTITQSLVSNPITNIRFVQPGHENTHEFAPFHPSIIAELEEVTVVRFMQTLEMTGGRYICDNGVAVTDPTCTSDWINRTTTDYQTQGAARGTAWEYVIDLSNEVGADLWANVIHHASDDYVRRIAEMIRDRLRRDLRVYVEWSNEPWAPDTTLFPQAQYVQNIGVLQFPADSGQPFVAGLKYQARRSGQVFRIFNEVFAGQEDRLVHVVAGWIGMPAVSDPLMSYMDDSTINTAGVRADMMAVGAYFGTHIPGWILFNGTENSITPSAILDQVELSLNTPTPNDDGGLEPSYRTYIRDQKTVADNHNVILGTYEGGQHLAQLQGFSNNAALSTRIIAANRDPRMYQIYEEFMNIWYQESGQGLLIPYSLIRHYTLQDEAFGHRESWNQPISQAHKYRAVVDRARTLRQ